ATTRRSANAPGRGSRLRLVSGVGLDLLEIERLEAALERRPTLAARLFTEGERAYAAARARPGQHLAARFCAKEAVAKALALEAWSWCDIEVVSEGGPPRIVLHGALAGRGIEVDVSLTHSRGTAGAVAVVRT
ncbi:MAG TPA: holo-ACP synthase, partial [Baekduia sp.]|nr:holo-ACP synthase [Baekduia sp.]